MGPSPKAEDAWDLPINFYGKVPSIFSLWCSQDTEGLWHLRLHPPEVNMHVGKGGWYNALCFGYTKTLAFLIKGIAYTPSTYSSALIETLNGTRLCYNIGQYYNKMTSTHEEVSKSYLDWNRCFGPQGEFTFLE